MQTSKAKNWNQTNGRQQEARSPRLIVGLGASVGGLKALTSFFENISPNTGNAFVVIVHLPSDGKSLMPELLSKITPMRVLLAADRMKVEPNSVYVIANGTVVGISSGSLEVRPRREIPGQFRPIDYFFRSLANDQKKKAVALMFSGGNSDGSESLGLIRDNGGMVFAQDHSAEMPVMPQAAIETGRVNFVLPRSEIAFRLNEGLGLSGGHF